MGKKGDLTLGTIISLIISGILLIALYQGGASLGNLDVYYKLAAARDISLIIDGMYSIPGNVEIKYQNDLSIHGVLIDDNSVRVYSASFGVNDFTAGEHRFYGQGVAKIEVKNPDTLLLRKIDGKISIANAPKDEKPK